MKKSIANSIFIYWLTLIIWQNLFTSTIRGVADTIVKIVLLCYLVISFHNNRTTNGLSSKGVFFFVTSFVGLLIFNEIFSSYFNIGNSLFYLFPCVYAYCVFNLGSKIGLTSSEIKNINKKIIYVVFLAVLYTVIFDFSQFRQALYATNGYGNELHGFFTSMYEFALYLFYAITCCIREIDDDSIDKKKHRLVYYMLTLIFFFVMILTFSRTIIVCCIVYMLIYALLNKNSHAGKFIIFTGIIGLILCIVVPSLNKYIFETVWKSGISNSRELLYATAITTYEDLPFCNQIFGLGVGMTRAYFLEAAGYGSTHNGYIQVLFYYGWVGIFWLVMLGLSQVRIIMMCFHYNRIAAVESLALLVAAFLSMIPSTVILFNSSIDAFFLTTFFIVIPRYRINYELYYTN